MVQARVKKHFVPNHPINLLHILPRLTNNGHSGGLIRVSKYLDKAKYNITFCSLSKPHHDATQYLTKQLGWRWVSLGVDQVWDVRTLSRIYRVIQEIQPHIVHTHVLRPDWYGRTAARLRRIPIVCTTVHGEDDLLYRRDYGYPPAIVRLIDSINRATACFAHAIVAVSEGVRSYLIDRQGIASSKIVVIPNGVDLEQFDPTLGNPAYLRKAFNLSDDSLVVGTVAALKQQKGLQYLVKAAAQVVTEYPTVRFVLIGSGPLESEVRTWISSAGLEQVFILAGQRQDIPQLLPGMDLFVFPSLAEGMPFALLEAMAMSRSCIATDIGGSREVIEHGVSGIIVPPRDSRALAEAILRLLPDAALRGALGLASRQRVEAQYSSKAIARAYDSLYQKLLTSECKDEWRGAVQK